MPSKDEQTSALELARIIERNRTVRVVAICANNLLSISLIVYGAIRILEPPWLVFF